MRRLILVFIAICSLFIPSAGLAADVLCICSYVDNQGNSIAKTSKHLVPNTGPASCDGLAGELYQANNCQSGLCTELPFMCKATATTYETIRCKCEVYSVQETTVQNGKISFANKLLATIYPNVDVSPTETKEEACNKKGVSLNKESQDTTINICKVDTFETTKIEDEFKLQAPTLQVNIPGFLGFTPTTSIMQEDGRAYFPWMGEYIRAIYNFGLIAISILAVFMIIVSGIRIIGSGLGGDRKEGYKRIAQAVIGLVIAWGSYTILYIINPNLLNLKSLGVQLIEPMEMYFNTDIGEEDREVISGFCGGKSGRPQTLASDLGLKGDLYQYSNYSTKFGAICSKPLTPDKIKAIVLHWTGGAQNETASGIVKWWGNPDIPEDNKSGSICQIIVDKSGNAFQITETLEETVICHGGSVGFKWNTGGIGIEIMGNGSNELLSNAAQKQAVVELVKKIVAKYNIPLTNNPANLCNGTGGIFSHKEITQIQSVPVKKQKPDPSEEYMKAIFKDLGATYIEWSKINVCTR